MRCISRNITFIPLLLASVPCLLPPSLTFTCKSRLAPTRAHFFRLAIRSFHPSLTRHRTTLGPIARLVTASSRKSANRGLKLRRPHERSGWLLQLIPTSPRLPTASHPSSKDARANPRKASASKPWSSKRSPTSPYYQTPKSCTDGNSHTLL